MRTPLRDNLTTFLGYTAQTPALKPVFTALAEDLADEKHRTALTERALQTPICTFLASFLGYAAKTAGAEAGVHGAGRGPGRRRSTENGADGAGVADAVGAHLANFLGYAAKTDELKPRLHHPRHGPRRAEEPRTPD